LLIVKLKPAFQEKTLCCLRGKSSAARAIGLIEIADPAFRDELDRRGSATCI
jgi:acyl-CoA hydrolase